MLDRITVFTHEWICHDTSLTDWWQHDLIKQRRPWTRDRSISWQLEKILSTSKQKQIEATNQNKTIFAKNNCTHALHQVVVQISFFTVLLGTLHNTIILAYVYMVIFSRRLTQTTWHGCKTGYDSNSLTKTHFMGSFVNSTVKKNLFLSSDTYMYICVLLS